MLKKTDPHGWLVDWRDRTRFFVAVVLLFMDGPATGPAARQLLAALIGTSTM